MLAPIELRKPFIELFGVVCKPEIAQVIDLSIWRDDTIPALDQLGIHLLDVCKWTLAVSDDIGVAKMRVRRKIHHLTYRILAMGPSFPFRRRTAARKIESSPHKCESPDDE